MARPETPPAAQRTRAAWGSLSRKQIVEAALAAERATGADRLTIRSLAADLGVAPMSIYRHVRDKDDLLDDVVDHLLAASWRPEAAPEDWRAWTIEAACRLHDLLVDRPVALHVYLRHPVVSPSALERMEAMLACLVAAGFAHSDALDAYAAIQTYTIGVAALAASRSMHGSSPHGRGAASSHHERDEPDERGSSLDGDLATWLARLTSPEQYRVGLDFLLDGAALAAGVRSGRPAGEPAAGS